MILSRFNPADRIVLIYNATLSFHIMVTHSRLDHWLALLGVHLSIFLAVWLMARHDSNQTGSVVHWLHTWYPIILLLWFYPETGMLRHTIITRDLDPELVAWETALFPQRFYFTIPLMLNLPTLEFLHGVYFSYYLLMWLPAFMAYKRRPNTVHEYVFVLILTMVVHFWLNIVFPALGPTPLRQQVMPAGFLFIPIMDFIYANVDQGGAAFPSTHAAAAVIVARYAMRFFPNLKVLFVLWLFLILISTVVCTFHYTIDTIVGTITGALFLFWGKQIHEKITY